MSTVELIAKERDRLLHNATGLVGVAATLVAFLALSVSGSVDWTNLLAALLLGVLLVFCYYRLGHDHSILWVLLGMVAGLGVLVVAQLPFGTMAGPALSSALLPFTAGALASFALVLTGTWWRLLILVAGFLAALGLQVLATPTAALFSFSTGAVLLGWICFAFVGFWVSSSVPRAARRIYSIGRAHRAERQASEMEAQRRQSARLLHDTVLATLTLFAHSGVGVSAETLRLQAAEDAQLLRQLRLGTAPASPAEETTPTGSIAVVETEDSILGTTLESVKQRFGRMGLEVSWHGTGQVLLPSDVLDAFLLALAECLENVRRHAGVTEAHVTITDDETTVRAMVTDSGVGFDVRDIDSARLGLKDSVVGRLGEVGGTARLFSAPGSGTTVVLEVPR
jgi:signal transduction histidine kinase